MEERNSFVLYSEYERAFLALPPEEQGALIMAVFAYARSGEVTPLSGGAAMAFLFIRAQMDRDWEKYDKSRQKRAEAGRKGGKRSQAMLSNGSNAKHCQANQADNENVDVDVDVNVDVNDNVNEDEDENIGDHIRPPPPDAATAAYRDRIDPEPPPTILDKLAHYAEEMGAECCIKAIDTALEAKAATWAYIEGVLSIKLSQGVKCIADWDAVEDRRRHQQRPAGGHTRAKGGGPSGGSAGRGRDPGGIKASMAWMDGFLAEQREASLGEAAAPDSRPPPR